MKSSKSHYDEQYFINRDLLDIYMAAIITRVFKEHATKRVLDIGCGTGQLISYLRTQGFAAFGVDPIKEAVKMARTRNPSYTIRQASGTKLPFKNKFFDAVVSVSVIEHIAPNDTQLFLSEIHRVLKPGGIVFLVTPNFASPWRFLQRKKWFGYSDPTHVRFFTPWELSKLLKEHGFTDSRRVFSSSMGIPYEWELPGLLSKLPKIIKSMLTYLLISTPLYLIRNSFWISAKKV